MYIYIIETVCVCVVYVCALTCLTAPRRPLLLHLIGDRTDAVCPQHTARKHDPENLNIYFFFFDFWS